MLKHVFICLLVLTTGLFAWQPPQPVSVEIDADNPVGYNTPFNVTITVELRTDVVLRGMETGDASLKIFLPPAMSLVSGELQWSGKLAAGEKKTINLSVRTTLSKPLIWDIGAVVSSNLLERPLTDRVSIYLEETRGRVLRNVDNQIEKEPWLKDALGFKTITVTRNGKSETMTVPVMGRLQTTEDPGTISMEEARPNRLYQQEWLEYLNPSAKKQDSGAGGKVKAATSPTRLAYDICAFYGEVKNSNHYGIDGIKVELLMYGQVVDSCFTEGGGAGGYGFYYECPEYPDAPSILITLQTRWGDVVRKPNAPYSPYALSLANYTKTQSWAYYFGCLDLSNWWDDYDEAGECFYELNRASELTHYDFDFADIEPVTVRYPVQMDSTYGLYIPDSQSIYINYNQWNSISHEYGHHIHFQKGMTDGTGNYHKRCDSPGYPYNTSKELGYIARIIHKSGFKVFVHRTKLRFRYDFKLGFTAHETDFVSVFAFSGL